MESDSQGADLVLPDALEALLPRVEEPRQRSIVDGKLIQVSVSQVKDFDDSTSEGCPRRWYYTKKERLPKPVFGFQKLGIELHKQYEHYFKTGQAVLGPLALEGKRFNPTPGADLLVEHPFELDADGVRFTGFIDLVNLRDPLEPWVYDHKTTSSAKWAKTEEALRDDVQQIVYSRWVLGQSPKAKRARFQLTYHLTKGGRIGSKAWAVSTCATVAENEFSWLTVKRKVSEMRHFAAAPNAEEVRAAGDVSACTAYGGCPFQDRCSRAPHRRANVDILDTLGIFEEAPSAPPPAPPKAGLIQDESTVPDEELKANPNRGQLDPRIVPHGVLPPDAPKSDPAAFAEAPSVPVEAADPPIKKTRKPRTVKGKNTITAPDGTQEITTIDEVETTGDKPPTITNVPEPVKHEPVQAPPPVPTQAPPVPVAAAPTPAVAAKPKPELVLFINCTPDGQALARLELFADKLARTMAAKLSIPDIRSQDAGPFAFGKWKGHLADMARANVPNGAFVVSTGVDDITDTVLSALTPFATTVVRGTR